MSIQPAPNRALVPSAPPLVVVISGPSGVGKDTVVRRMEEMGYPFHFVVTATSRPRRENEVDGRDYHFVTTAQFEEMIRNDELLEHAIVYGQYKGIPKSHIREALASGKDVILRIDVQGAATVRRLIPDAVTIFLTAGSEEELFRRLRTRKTEDPEQLRKRMETAREEMKHLPEFDYVVVNSDCHLDDAVRTIVAIITAEKCRTHPRRAHL
ncbi:MAG: guanylate kinase [Anaerolineales bacterium]